MNPKIDEYINKAKQWQEEMELLRSILLSCQLTEELKWGVPCYTFQKSNVVLIHAFKEYVGLGFFKGALLKDDANLLSKPGENSQSSRHNGCIGAARITCSRTIGTRSRCSP